MERNGVLIELVAPLYESAMQALDTRLDEVRIACKCFVQGFGYLALRGDAAVKVQYKVAKADLIQAPQDSVDRGSLFRDEQNMLASGDQRRNEIGDRLALAGSRSEGDRLQQLRAVLPCEVRVVAETHPLFGRLVAAKSFKRWNGVLLLVIDLPDGSPGTIRCDATDVLGVVEPGPRSVLDGAGLRALHRLVVQLATRAEVDVSGVGAQVGSPRP